MRAAAGGASASPSIVAPPAVVEAYRHAIGATFDFGALVAALALAVVVLLPELPLRGGSVGSDWHPAPSRPVSSDPE
jgi:hypothetical protein